MEIIFLLALPSPYGESKGSMTGFSIYSFISEIIVSLFVPTILLKPIFTDSGLSEDNTFMSCVRQLYYDYLG